MVLKLAPQFVDSAIATFPVRLADSQLMGIKPAGQLPPLGEETVIVAPVPVSMTDPQSDPMSTKQDFSPALSGWKDTVTACVSFSPRL
jgi:hypothetical protein